MEILLVMEERLKALDFGERFKLAVISSDPDRWVKAMFPNWVGSGAAAANEVVVNPDEVDLSDTTGRWVFTEEISPEEALAELMRDGQQVGGIADLGGEWLEV